jgi:hypothetical protein
MRIYQIFYDQKTKDNLDPKFIPFDNTNPSDPSWYEFEIIRKILESNFFDDNEFIGIFSPRFFEKTGMSGSNVFAIVEKSKSEVISFSPDFQASALYLNPFIQADLFHPGFLSCAQKAYQHIGFDIDLNYIVSSSFRTIFSNYWVAKYSFWKVWFKYALKLYFLSSNKSKLISKKMNALTFHRNIKNYPMKIFILERLITVLLEDLNIDAELAINYHEHYLKKNFSNERIKQMFLLDSLKLSFKQNTDQALLNLYLEKKHAYEYNVSNHLY